MGSSGDFEEFSIYCENGEWLELGQVKRCSHARDPSLMVLGNDVAYFPNSASYCDLPSRLTRSFSVELRITPLSERLKVDFALIDQNIANQILWLVSHALS